MTSILSERGLHGKEYTEMQECGCGLLVRRQRRRGKKKVQQVFVCDLLLWTTGLSLFVSYVKGRTEAETKSSKALHGSMSLSTRCHKQVIKFKLNER